MLKLARNVILIHVVVFSKVEFKLSTRDQQQIIDIEVGISQVQKLLQRLILQFKTSYYIYVFNFFPTIKKKKEKEIK